MKNILGALGASFCFACFFLPVQAEVSSSAQGSLVKQERHRKQNRANFAEKQKKAKAISSVSTPTYCEVITADRETPYPAIGLSETPYPLLLESLKLASAGDFTLDDTKTILTVTKGGIYECSISLRFAGVPVYSGLSSIGFTWLGLALSDSNGPLERFRIYGSQTDIQGALEGSSIAFTWREFFLESSKCLLSIPAGTQLKLNAERSFNGFLMVGDGLTPALRLRFEKIPDLSA